MIDYNMPPLASTTNAAYESYLSDGDDGHTLSEPEPAQSEPAEQVALDETPEGNDEEGEPPADEDEEGEPA